MRKKITILLLMLFALGTVRSQTALDTLKIYVAALQKDPVDHTLNEDIIILARRVKPAPVISEEAKEKIIKGVTFREAGEYELALENFKAAVLLAPWWGKGYLELGITYEINEQFDEAIEAYQLYILTNPGEEAVARAREGIIVLKTKKEIAVIKKAKEARESNIKAENENAEKEEEERKNSFEGGWIVTFSTMQGAPGGSVGNNVNISKDENGNYVVSGISWYFDESVFTGNGRTLTGQVVPNLAQLSDLYQTTPQSVLSKAVGKVVYTCILKLSEDGENVYAEQDNYSVNYTRNTYTTEFTKVERQAGYFKYTLKRDNSRPLVRKTAEELKAEQEKRKKENEISVKIGGQRWMNKNLDVSHYRNGDPIPQVQDPIAWKSLKTGAWCYYNNDSSNAKYGKLYNLYAVLDPRGLAPEGWHIPDKSEWQTLIDHFGGVGVARFSAPPKHSGTKMKSAAGWEKASDNGTDTEGFTALPAGCRHKKGNFTFQGKLAAFWSADGPGSELSVSLNQLAFKTEVFIMPFPASMGMSVRCIKD